MTEQVITFLARYKIDIVYSILAVVAFFIVFYMIMASVMVSYFVRYKQVLYASEKLLKELYKSEPRVDGFEEFRSIVRVIRNIDKSQGGLNYLRTLSDHCKPEILIMKSIYKEGLEGDSDISVLIKMLNEDLRTKIGIVDGLTNRVEAEV